jgi:hypothetical protein
MSASAPLLNCGAEGIYVGAPSACIWLGRVDFKRTATTDNLLKPTNCHRMACGGLHVPTTGLD